MPKSGKAKVSNPDSKNIHSDSINAISKLIYRDNNSRYYVQGTLGSKLKIKIFLTVTLYHEYHFTDDKTEANEQFGEDILSPGLVEC
jgi:hypothetical protein